MTIKSILTPLITLPIATGTFAQNNDSRPNILLFMVDDMGWQDTSVPFADSITANNRKFHTPNMERLAAKGVKFTQAYASAISSPTRCSLITGANAARHRVTNWTLRRDTKTDGQSTVVESPDWNYNGIQMVNTINNSFAGTSFVETLRRNGYHTIHVGKAHFGAMDTPGENPIHFGFETNITGSAAGGLATYLSEYNYGHDKDGNPVSPFAIEGLEKYWGTGTFVTEALTQEAIKALDKATRYNQPWFLYMAHYAVHIPIDRDNRFYQYYIDKGLGEKEAAYASLVEGMDKSLGDLLNWIEVNGQADNTIVIFMSDNGGYTASNHWREGPLHTQNAPLRGGKGSLLEGGIREPMIVYWPSVTKPATTICDPIIIEDFYPTILDMAGIENHDKVDGVSFAPIIKGSAKTDPERIFIWNYPHSWGENGPGINFFCAIRQGNWKMLYNYITGEKQLYNLSDDPFEHNNLALTNQAQATHMSTLLGNRLRQIHAQRPIFKATGKPCPWPDEISTNKH